MQVTSHEIVYRRAGDVDARAAAPLKRDPGDASARDRFTRPLCYHITYKRLHASMLKAYSLIDSISRRRLVCRAAKARIFG